MKTFKLIDGETITLEKDLDLESFNLSEEEAATLLEAHFTYLVEKGISIKKIKPYELDSFLDYFINTFKKDPDLILRMAILGVMLDAY